MIDIKNVFLEREQFDPERTTRLSNMFFSSYSMTKKKRKLTINSLIPQLQDKWNLP